MATSRSAMRMLESRLDATALWTEGDDEDWPIFRWTSGLRIDQDTGLSLKLKMTSKYMVRYKHLCAACVTHPGLLDHGVPSPVVCLRSSGTGSCLGSVEFVSIISNYYR